MRLGRNAPWNQRDLEEEYDRFLKEQLPHLSEDQRARILALSSDLPALWNAPATTAADRKEIIRLLVERVVVHVRTDSERGEAVISWRGGVTTRHEMIRPVSRYESLGRYAQLINRIVELAGRGRRSARSRHSSTEKSITPQDPGRVTRARRCGSSCLIAS